MAWVMSTRRTERPVAYQFLIGDLQVAEVSFAGSRAILSTMTDRTDHPTMSDAMKEMHRRLNSPPAERERV